MTDRDEFMMVGDLVRECRDLARSRRMGALAWTVLTRRSDLRLGYRLVRKLPIVEFRLSDDPSAQMLRTRLGGKLPGRPIRVARSALFLPDDRATYLRGRKRQAVRTNLRHAQHEGITSHTLQSVAEQDAALSSFFGSNGFTDADRLYVERKLGVTPGGQEFFVSRDKDGNTIAVAAVIVSDGCALLVFHHAAPNAWKARYALSVHTINTLIDRGVKVLLVGSALTLEPGLRYFQQRLGFVPVNVREIDQPLFSQAGSHVLQLVLRLGLVLFGGRWVAAELLDLGAFGGLAP
jgi:hypothetical protein